MRVPFVLLCAVVLAGASLPALSLVSVQDEIAIGRQAQKQVKEEVPEVTDAKVAAYVAGIGRRLAARATGAKYPYSFTVADYREINAFALPGGPVWVHRGALAAAANEAQLASVLAHEVAHIAKRHAAGQITKQLLAQGVLGLLGAVLGNDRGGARAAQIGAQVLAGGYMLKFSRDDEREADAIGAQIMRRAGWDAREMIAFMQTLQRAQGSNPGAVQTFLSSHPAPGERVTRLRTQLRGASGGTRDTQQFRGIRARLSQLPPARSMPRR